MSVFLFVMGTSRFLEDRNSEYALERNHPSIFTLFLLELAHSMTLRQRFLEPMGLEFDIL